MNRVTVTGSRFGAEMARSERAIWFACRWLILAGIATLLATWIRFRHLDQLTFRIDEGYTLTYSRQGWVDVLGWHGFYAPHPPLYFTLAKFANVFVREEIAARSVAALAGVLTVPLVFWIARRLAGPAVGAVAAFGVALSPTLIEFSRDGRMYAPVIFTIVLSYAMLLKFDANPGPLTAALYGIAISLSIYLDYSAAYALIPQGFYLVFVGVRHRREAKWLVAACVLAALSYAPWIPQVVDTVDTLRASGEETNRGDSLSNDWQNVSWSVRYVLGIDGRGSAGIDGQEAIGGIRNTWDRWPDVRIALLALFAAVAIVGLLYARHNRPLLLVSLGLMLGTPVTAAFMSEISPGYAARTIQIAFVGWAILAACALCGLYTSPRYRSLGRIAAVAVGAVFIFVWTATMPATLSSQGRYEWREIAARIEAPDYPGTPIITLSNMGMMTDLLELYGDPAPDGARIITLTDGRRELWTGADRWLDRGPTRAQVKGGALQDILPPGPEYANVWLLSRLGNSTVVPALESLGYVLVLKTDYYGAALSLWHREAEG